MSTKFFITLSAIIMLLMAGIQVNATTYSYIHVDSTFTNGFTATYCPYSDSIMIIGPAGGGTSNWRYEGGGHLENSDTLSLPVGWIGWIGDSLSISGEVFNFYITPLTDTATGVEVSCGDSAMLVVLTNYQGTGTLTYSWSPTTGLSNPNVANPYAYPVTQGSTIYKASVTIDGCTVTDITAVSYIPVETPEICMVGVDSATNKNIIIWDKPLTTKIDSFAVYRETEISGVFAKIGAIPYTSQNVFIDMSSNPNVQSNTYRISIIDKCGFEMPYSGYHKTMHLSINQGVGNTWNLIWEAYEGFEVSSYQIYRGTTAGNLQLIGTTSGSSTQYSDFTAPAGYIYYQIKAINPGACNSSKSYTLSASNIATNNPLGIFENNNATDLFLVYPNPANDKIVLSLFKKSKIEILTIEGQIVKTIDGADTKLTIDLKNLSRGVYLIKATTSDEDISIKRFIKQ
jgi:hypothetical protein